MSKNFTIFGKGFVGENLYKFLKKKNCNLFMPNKGKYKFKENLNHIVYCIGNQNWLKNPKKTYEANLDMMTKILFNNKFKSFTLISSTRLYFSNLKENTSETSFIKINTNEKKFLYNSLKISAENLCLCLDKAGVKVVRISNLYANKFTNQAYVLPSLIRDSVKKKCINITINKNSTKDFIHVEDAFNVLFKIIMKGKYRMYNIASGQNISLDQISKKIKKITNCKILYKKNLMTLKEPKINITRIKKEFNFRPKYNLINFIEELIKNQKNSY
jgi:nucleoside-diphosphate-sugar epimerase